MLNTAALDADDPPIVVGTLPYPTLPHAIWLMLLLFLCANLYNIDRLIVGVLADQIKADIGVSDVQMSLLIGLAYSLLSVVFGLFLGLYVDRANRRTVVAISLTVWSLATLAGGLSASFGQLFACRALVGLGEAALAPGAMSLIADIFPPGKRAKALAVYSMGATFGSSLSVIIPGLIAGANWHVYAPFVGLLTPWRLTFVTCGLAGPVIAALLFLTTREPHRQGVIAAPDRTSAASLKVNLHYIFGQASVFIPFLVGIGLFYTGLLAVTSWTTVFLTRHFGLTLAQVAGVLGLSLLISGLAGYAVGGIVIDTKALRRSVPKLGIMLAAPLIGLPAAFAVFAPSLPIALVLLSTITFAAPLLNVGNGALVQDLLPNNMRGFTLSLCTVATTVLGFVCGPLLVALATEHLFKDPHLIGYSLLVVAAPSLIGASLCYALAIAGLRRHTARGSLIVEVMRASGGA